MAYGRKYGRNVKMRCAFLFLFVAELSAAPAWNPTRPGETSAEMGTVGRLYCLGDELFISQSSFNPEVNDPNLEFDVKRNLNRRTHNAVRP